MLFFKDNRRISVSDGYRECFRWMVDKSLLLVAFFKNHWNRHEPAFRGCKTMNDIQYVE